MQHIGQGVVGAVHRAFLTFAAGLVLWSGAIAPVAIAQPASSGSGSPPGDATTQQPEAPQSNGVSSGSASTQESAATTADPEHAEKVSEALAVSHYTLASWYFSKWSLRLAQVELDVAVMHWPGFTLAHRDLCLVCLCRGELLRSLAEAMMVVGLGTPIPLNAHERNQLEEVALVLHYNKGIEQGTKSHWKDAISEFSWALSYDPGDPQIHRSLAFAYANLGDFNQAEKQYALSFSLDPADPYGHADFANILADKGQQQRALSQMSEAVKLAPNAAALHVDLGWMAESHGDLKTADQEFQKAVKLSPQHPGLWTHLGRILEREGKPAEAIDAYNKALALDPGREDARVRIAKLKAQSHS